MDNRKFCGSFKTYLCSLSPHSQSWCRGLLSGSPQSPLLYQDRWPLHRILPGADRACLCKPPPVFATLELMICIDLNIENPKSYPRAVKSNLASAACSPGVAIGGTFESQSDGPGEVGGSQPKLDISLTALDVTLSHPKPTLCVSQFHSVTVLECHSVTV